MPNNPNEDSTSNQRAADLIRQKLSLIYGKEPDAKKEAEEVKSEGPHSKHQQFMQRLINSGKGIAAIQTDWHNYYLRLDEDEKKQVWDEFYASNKNMHEASATASQQNLAQLKNQVISSKFQPKAQPEPTRPKPSRIAQSIRSRVTANGQLKAKHHLQSLLFGLGLGGIVIVIFLFSFFNEVIIAPLIQPSRNVNSTPVIIGSAGIAPTPNPEVIIPKINVEIPVDYSVTTTNENTIENDLEAGVVHYPTTVEPGQLGNAAFFGHSSNNIFNPGKYKFAFVLLHTIQNGDTFYLTYNHLVYIYKVVSTSIVDPSDIAVLGPVAGQSATATLITCDPPGTSLHRLVVVGQQISPSPSANTAPTTQVIASSTPSLLPGNGPTLWTRFIGSTSGKVTIVVFSIFVIIVVFRRLNKRNY